MTDALTPPADAVARLTALADDYASRGDFGTEDDLRTLLAAYADAARDRERIAGLVAETFNAIPRYRMVKQAEPRRKPPVVEFTYHDPKRHKGVARAMDAAQVMDAFAALLDRLREGA